VSCLNLEKVARIADGSFELEAIANDSGIRQQAFDRTPIEASDPGRIESGEGFAVRRPFVQHGRP
jgi:hypothetical protein